MKKTILWSVLTFGALTLQAQNMVVPNGGFFDNWSIGINGGGTMQMKGGSYFKSARPVFGMNINKQWTPILGMEIHGQGFINTSSSRTAIDASDVSLLGKMNLMNLFGGYLGEPRCMEIETVSGIGWMHNYMNGSGDSNDLTSRVGLNFNFNSTFYYCNVVCNAYCTQTIGSFIKIEVTCDNIEQGSLPTAV